MTINASGLAHSPKIIALTTLNAGPIILFFALQHNLTFSLKDKVTSVTHILHYTLI